MWLFAETDLEAASVAKHGAAGYAKKVAARQKREANKRKRDESAAVAKENVANVHQEELAADPALAKREAAKKQRQDAKAAVVKSRNLRIVGKPWNLVIVTPASVAGTKATLELKQLPPDGWPGDSTISCDDFQSQAYSYGNIHGFAGGSCEADTDMKFETKWKVMGKRHTGKITVRVQPNDHGDGAGGVKGGAQEAGEKGEKGEKGAASSAEKTSGEESLMITGKFDSGVNDGVRRWTFKGYRQ
jgi:hypothetical protein